MIPVKVAQWAGVAVVVIGTAAVAYVSGYSPFSGPGKTGGEAGAPAVPSADGTQPAGKAATDAAPATGSDTAAPAVASKAEEMATADVVTPSFGILRVEPDGSLVVAGSAGSEAGVELISGTRKLGETKAGREGDFAIVLDQPLKPGDYQLVLRSTERDGRAATSVETAVVAVPETKDGQVLALVEQPGKPSRLITTPSAPAEDGKPAEKAAGDATPAAADTPAPASDETRAPAEVATADGTAPAASATDGKDQAAPAAGTAVDASVAVEPATKAAEADGATMAAADKQEQAPAAGTDEPAAAEGKPEDKPVETAMVDPKDAAAPAATGPQKAPAETAVKAAEKLLVVVEAVEIEGRNVFVAGLATGGKRVRVYANDILLGDAIVSDGGRFLVEATRDLPVGDYIIRADLLDANNADVVARAAVPFQRQAGESVAAVAPAAGQGDAPVQTPVAQSAPGTPATAQSGEGQDQAPATAMGEDDKPAVAGEAPATAVDTGTAMTADGGEATMPPAVSEAVATTAPALEATQGSVIIRRGDTLWQISRRVYGRGVRFSTIYLANQEQISDPNRIWPGQVFRVPGETPEGEAADMSTVESPPEAGAASEPARQID